MIIDANLLFSDEQAITVDANSTNVVDLGTTRDIARGQPMRFRCQVDTTLDSSGEAATLGVKLVTSAAANLGTPTTLWDSGTLTEATLVAGYVIADIVVPATALRYLGVIYDNGTEAFTSGNISAFLTPDTPTAEAAKVLGTTGL